MHSDYAMFRFHKSCCMDRLIKVLCLITCMTIPATALAGNKGDKKSSGVNWEPATGVFHVPVLYRLGKTVQREHDG